MSGPTAADELPIFPQSDFEKVTATISAEFQVEESLIEHAVPTYYLKQPQETKKSFLRVLKALEPMSLIAILRKMDGRLVLKVISKPAVKPSNVLVNWILFFATIVTTFVTGYMLSSDIIDPLLGGATFTVAVMAVLGTHEMGHKLTANKRGMEATPPYFIPGPPPLGGFGGIGTFGAVIFQKSLPANRDALFDIGANGPIAGFLIAVFAFIIGFPFSVYKWIPIDSSTIAPPLVFYLLSMTLSPFGAIPPQPSGDYLLAIILHPVAFAGWVGIVVTMLNLLPAAMLDGGHVARSLTGEKIRLGLSAVSILYLFLVGFYPMGLLVLFMSLYKHPGPLDDVSPLSTSRKLAVLGLVAIFVLCTPIWLTF